ncbi:MAG: metallophosphoesterase family protein [Pseudomonadales bacterium]
MFATRSKKATKLRPQAQPRFRWLLLLIAALSGLSVAAAEPSLPAAAKHEFHFAVLGDSQFDDPIAYNRLINDLVWLRPAFAIQVGDMIEGYNDSSAVAAEWQRFKGQIEPLAGAGIAFLPVAGNHELYGSDRTPNADLHALYEQNWGNSYYRFDYRNSTFIVLNSDEPATAKAISAKQWQWLKASLQSAQASEHRFVFLHRPPDSLSQSDALHELFAKYQVHTVFYGHHHHYHYRKRDGVQYVMTNAAADSGTTLDAAGSFDHVLQVSVRDEQVSLAVIRAGSIKPPDAVKAQDNYDLFALKRNLLATPVQLRPLRKQGENAERYGLRLQLHNTSERSVTIYLSCRSEDGRWQFEPRQLEPVELAPAEEHAVELLASLNSVSESLPECTAAFPFQVHTGQWYTEHVSIRAVHPRP